MHLISAGGLGGDTGLSKCRPSSLESKETNCRSVKDEKHYSKKVMCAWFVVNMPRNRNRLWSFKSPCSWTECPVKSQSIVSHHLCGPRSRMFTESEKQPWTRLNSTDATTARQTPECIEYIVWSRLQCRAAARGLQAAHTALLLEQWEQRTQI